eukprot:6177_1
MPRIFSKQISVHQYFRVSAITAVAQTHKPSPNSSWSTRSLNVKDHHGCTALSLTLESGMDDVVTAFMVCSPTSEQLALREWKTADEETYYVDLRGDEDMVDLYIQHLSEQHTAEDLFNLLRTNVTIVSHKLLTDPSGLCTGVGFVRFMSQQDGEAAILALDGMCTSEIFPTDRPISVHVTVADVVLNLATVNRRVATVKPHMATFNCYRQCVDNSPRTVNRHPTVSRKRPTVRSLSSRMTKHQSSRITGKQTTVKQPNNRVTASRADMVSNSSRIKKYIPGFDLHTVIGHCMLIKYTLSIKKKKKKKKKKK